MTTQAHWLGALSGMLFALLVVEMVRRRYLRGRFALVWLVMGIGAATLALFPTVLERTADLTGVAVPLNLLLFLGSLAMLVLIMQLSAEVGRLHDRTRVLAEEVALLRAADVGRPQPGLPSSDGAGAQATPPDSPASLRIAGTGPDGALPKL